MKKLSHSEMLSLELNHEKIKVLKSERELISVKQENLALKLSIMNYQKQDLSKEAAIARNKMANIELLIEKQNAESKQTSEKIKKRLKINGSFGYDPETLEVIEEKEKQ